MKKLLLLIASLTLAAPAANAESYWLIIVARGTGSKGLEKIEMTSMESCEEEGAKWRDNSKTWHYHHCVVGK